MSKIWGSSVWYLFHSLAEKISEEGYNNLKNELCNLIQTICFNLPCIECAKHATEYTKKTLNAKLLPTKDHLKIYLFNFHNSVNERLKKQSFNNYDMYKQSNLKLIFQNFKLHYLRYRDHSRGFTDTMVRERIIKQLDDFMIKNYIYFQ